jgi:hypothetical protein
LHVIPKTTPNLSENIVLIALKFYACKRMDPKQVWGEEHQVVIISLPRSMVGLSGECIWLTNASAWLVVKCKVEAR